MMAKLVDKTMLGEAKTIRTTLTIPADLNERSQHFIDQGIAPSRNALIVTALETYLAALERQEIDRQFEVMADDEEYQELNRQIAESFAESDCSGTYTAEC